mmetsp:Transcript_70438/g.206044  ORF Transcript_70438/g.206044 Transcript_70438/m.206044 type:complete len:692 (-) Transcript_70438:102-2177(-)
MPHLHLLFFLASITSAIVEGDDEACAGPAPGKEPPLIASLAADFSCGGAAPSGAASPNQNDLDCLFSALYPARAGHGGTAHRAREMTYGELRPEALTMLLEGDGLMGVPAESQDAFVDLGSGTGKLAIQAFLHGLHDSRGVELAEDRHGLAAAALASLNEKLNSSHLNASQGLTQLSLQHGGATVALAQGDLLQYDLAAATSVVFSSTLCFPESLLAGLAAKLRNELPVGALFWSLKELPSGGHDGLALMAKLAVRSSWSSQTRILVYIRTPQVRPLAQLSPQVAAASLAEDAHSTFAKLQAVLGVKEDGGWELRGDRDLPTAFSATLGARNALATVRLLRAFGARRPRNRDDLCGCTLPNGGPTSWSLMPSDLGSMLGHGVFLANASQHNCLTLGHSCTLSDLMTSAVFESIRKAERCKSDKGRGQCGILGADDDIAVHARGLEGWPCSRSSDGRTLLQAALFRDRPELGELTLEAAGNASFACVDQEGQNSMHVTVRHSGGRTLSWLIDFLASQGDVGRAALTNADGWGRVPVGLVRDAAALRALHAAGAVDEGVINATDASGRSPLAQAVQRGDEDLAKALLELRADASSSPAEMDASPLMLAARSHRESGARLVRLLVAHRADLHAQHGTARTAPIHVAASHGGPETVKALLELGANPDAEALHGMRPEHLATDPKVLALLRGEVRE